MVLLAEEGGGGEQILTTTKYRHILYLSLLQDLSYDYETVFRKKCRRKKIEEKNFLLKN
jgi:hypothetical protein